MKLRYDTIAAVITHKSDSDRLSLQFEADGSANLFVDEADASTSIYLSAKAVSKLARLINTAQ